MQERKRLQATKKLASEFFTALSAGYFFGISLSPNPVILTDNIIFCILCLLAAYYFGQPPKDE